MLSYLTPEQRAVVDTFLDKTVLEVLTTISINSPSIKLMDNRPIYIESKVGSVYYPEKFYFPFVSHAMLKALIDRLQEIYKGEKFAE